MRKLVMLGIILGSIFLTGCESAKRVGKDLSSDFGGGLDRTISVYTITGEKLAEYVGRADIDSENNWVEFDMDGKRVIIYNATVIAEEN